MKKTHAKAIKKVAKGGAFILLGIALSSASFFLYRLLAARYLGPDDYGLLMLGIITLKTTSLLALLGIHQSVGTFFSQYLVRKQFAQAKGFVVVSLALTLGVGLLLSVLLYFSSSVIAQNLFGMHYLQPVIAIFAIGIPLSALAQLLKQYFYAFNRPVFGVYSESVAEKALNVLLLLLIMYFSLSLSTLSWAYVLVLFLSSVLALFLSIPLFSSLWKKSSSPQFPTKKLLAFSLPLVAVGILDLALGWADMILLGVFGTSADVGLYSAGYILASSLVLIWVALGDMFYPVISELKAKRAVAILARTFEVTSRWIFVLVIPVVCFLLVFPTRSLSLVFGSEYLQAGVSLAILTVGYFILTVFGLAEQGLRTYRKTLALSVVTLGSFIINLILNLVLIPLYGMIGAAIATTVSLSVFALGKLWLFYRCVHFTFKWKFYVVYTLCALISLALVFIPLHLLGFTSTIPYLLGICVYVAVYFGLQFVVRYFTEDDVMVLQAVGRNSKILAPIVRLLVGKIPK